MLHNRQTAGLEYKMRRKSSAKHNLLNGTAPFSFSSPENHDEYLESAETFYKQPLQIHFEKEAKKDSRKKKLVPPSFNPIKEKSSLKHLEEYWKKQTFKFQEKVQVLEEEVRKVKNQNRRLEKEIEVWRQMEAQKKQLVQLIHSYSSQIDDLTLKLIKKTQTINNLEDEIKKYKEELEERNCEEVEDRNREEEEKFKGGNIEEESQLTKCFLETSLENTFKNQKQEDQKINTILEALHKNIEALEFLDSNCEKRIKHNIEF